MQEGCKQHPELPGLQSRITCFKFDYLSCMTHVQSIFKCDEVVRKTDWGKAANRFWVKNLEHMQFPSLFLTKLYELAVVVFTSWGIKINIINTELQFCNKLFCLVSVSKPSWVQKLLLTTYKYYKHDDSRISAFEITLGIALPGVTWVTDPQKGSHWSPLCLVVEINWNGRTTQGRSWLYLLSSEAPKGPCPWRRQAFFLQEHWFQMVLDNE